MRMELSADIMFVKKFPFLVSVSHRLKFTTIEYVPNWKKEQLHKSLSKILQLYKSRGFEVNVVHMDPEFECLVDTMSETKINTTVAREHVPVAELQIQVIKQRMRAVQSG